MSGDPGKSPFQELFELWRFSTAALFAGIVAAVYMMQKPLLSILFGLAGIVCFVLSRKIDKDAERIEKLLALWGLAFSVMSLIYVFVNMITGVVFSN